jgi:hypothetical protein
MTPEQVARVLTAAYRYVGAKAPLPAMLEAAIAECGAIEQEDAVSFGPQSPIKLKADGFSGSGVGGFSASGSGGYGPSYSKQGCRHGGPIHDASCVHGLWPGVEGQLMTWHDQDAALTGAEDGGGIFHQVNPVEEAHRIVVMFGRDSAEAQAFDLWLRDVGMKAFRSWQLRRTTQLPVLTEPPPGAVVGQYESAPRMVTQLPGEVPLPLSFGYCPTCGSIDPADMRGAEHCSDPFHKRPPVKAEAVTQPVKAVAVGPDMTQVYHAFEPVGTVGVAATTCKECSGTPNDEQHIAKNDTAPRRPRRRATT